MIMSFTSPVAPLHRSGDAGSALETECLFGEQFKVQSESDGWVKGQLLTDGYDGWVESSHLGKQTSPTHRILVPRSVLTTERDIKSSTLFALSMGACVTVLETSDRVSSISNGDEIAFLPAHHVGSIDQVVNDWVGTAENFLRVPYRWGGRDSLGLDCSALVQLSLQSGGLASPRNASDQEKALGTRLPEDAPLTRGDLVFWVGHVGIMLDGDHLIHANAFHSQVAIEPLKTAEERIGSTDGLITSVKRLLL